MPLPVPLPPARYPMRQRRACNQHVEHAIRLPAVVLAPSHFVCVGMEIRAADVMMRADLSPAQPRQTSEWGRRQDLNLRPPCPYCQVCDSPYVESRALYPAELRHLVSNKP